MRKNGIYVQGLPQDLDGTAYVKHTIVQVNEPNEKGFCEEAKVRHAYLRAGIQEVYPSGSLISFDVDTKTSRKDGKEYEKIVPVDIKLVKPIQKSIGSPNAKGEVAY